MTVFRWLALIDRLSFLFSLITNSLLILAALGKKNRQVLGNYKYLIIQFAFLDIFYSIVHVFSKPRFYYSDNVFFIYAQASENYIGKQPLRILMCLECSCYCSSLATFAVHFYYRYHVILNVKTSSKCWVIYLSIIPLFYGVSWALTLYFVFGESPEINNILLEKFLDRTEGVTQSQLVYFAPGIRRNGVNYDWKSILGVSWYWFLVGSSLLSMFYYIGRTSAVVFSTTRIFPEHNKLISRAQSVEQRQYFIALTIQAVIPLIFLYIPVFTLTCSTYLSHDISTVSMVVHIFIAAYPAFDPLPLILIVKSFRERISDGYKVVVASLPRF